MEYSAGLIQIGQPLYAIKLLSNAAERIKETKMDEWINEDNANNMNEGIILALMGLQIFRGEHTFL